MSSEKTAGQMAYEAFKAWRAERDPMMICTDWTHPAVAHEGWEAVGRAVETEQVRLARQDRDQLRTAVLSLAADLEESAARTAPSKKSSIESEIAIHLRKTAGPPS